MAPKKKPRAKPKVVEEDEEEEEYTGANDINLVPYIILTPILFIVLIVGAAFFWVSVSNKEMASTEAITTMFKHLIDLLMFYLENNKPPTPPPAA